MAWRCTAIANRLATVADGSTEEEGGRLVTEAESMGEEEDDYNVTVREKEVEGKE